MSWVSTWFGDPVNLVTGNVYHAERDLAIPGRGGLPLVFERSYNSRLPQDGPLGYDWTHSFYHQLKFYGVEGGAAKVSWVDGSGNEKFFASASHSNGNIVSGAVLTNPAGVYVRFERLGDGTGRYRITEKNGLAYTFESATGPSTPPALGAEPRARLLSIQDRNGNALSLAYDSGCGAGLLCTVTDGAGRSLTFTYTQGRLIQLSDGSGRVWRYTYDGAGHLVSYQSPLAVSGQHGAVSYAYYTAADGANLAHALKTVTKPLGNGMAFEYYADGRAFRHTPFDAQGPRTSEAVTFRYNDFRRETVTTNARGFQRAFRFDEWGNPVRIVDEAGAAYTYAYDAAHPYLRRSETDPVGQVTRYAYDGFGNLTQITLPSQRTQPGVHDRVRYTGSSAATFHQPQKIQDARGNVTLLRYDARGNLTDVIALKSGLDPVLPYTPEATQIAAWTVYGYDGFGNRTHIKRVRDMARQIANPAGPTGPTLTTAYDAQGLYPVSVSRLGDQNGDGRIDAADPVDFLPLRYDVLGRPRYGLDADWHRTRAAYDADDRLVGATDALGHWREVRYDGNGRPVLESLTYAGSLTRGPALLDRQTRRYDGADRLEARIDAGGGVTRYTWDEAGNLSQITDPDGHTVRFAYDAADRLIRATDRAGHTMVTERDGAGRIRAVTDPNGNTTAYAYWDATRAGRLKTVTLPAVQCRLVKPHLYCRLGLGLRRDFGLEAVRPGRLSSRVLA